MSKLWRFVVILTLALFSTPAFAQTSDEQIAQEIRTLEDQLSAALVARDAAALDQLWHDDLVFIARNGSQTGKAERIAGQAASPPQAGESNTNDSVDVRVIGDAAVATVVSTWSFPGEQAPIVGRYRALHVWTREGGEWRLLAAQVASITE